MRSQFQGQPAIGRGQLERGYADAFDAQQGQLHGISIRRFAKLGCCFSAIPLPSQSGYAEQSGGTQQAAEFPRLKRARHLGKVAVAGPCQRLAGVEGRRGRMGARETVAGYHELAVAGDAAFGIPTAAGYQAVQDQAA